MMRAIFWRKHLLKEEVLGEIRASCTYWEELGVHQWGQRYTSLAGIDAHRCWQCNRNDRVLFSLQLSSAVKLNTLQAVGHSGNYRQTMSILQTGAKQTRVSQCWHCKRPQLCLSSRPPNHRQQMLLDSWSYGAAKAQPWGAAGSEHNPMGPCHASSQQQHKRRAVQNKKHGLNNSKEGAEILKSWAKIQMDVPGPALTPLSYHGLKAIIFYGWFNLDVLAPSRFNPHGSGLKYSDMTS